MSIQTVSKSSPLYTRTGRTYVPVKVRTTRRRKFTIPLLTIGAVSVGSGPAIQYCMNRQWTLARNSFVHNYLGYYIPDGSFKFSRLAKGWVPLFLVYLVGKTGVTRGVNARLAQIGIPLRLS